MTGSRCPITTKQMKQTKIAQADKTEIQIIRETLGYSRPMFAEKIIHKSNGMLRLYENRKAEVPESVLVIARLWLDFYNKQNGITE